MRRKGILLVLVMTTSLVLATGAGSAEPQHHQQAAYSNQEDRAVTLMTRNVYHGVDAELAQAGAARSFGEFLNATADIFNGYQERKFPERAAALATEIETEQPDLIGLQEAVVVRKDTPADGPATPANEESLDYLEILLDELEERGLHYEPVVTATNWDVEVPTALGFDLRHTDRVVTLIRTNDANLEISNTETGHFDTNCKLPTALGQMEIKRGWALADVKIRGKAVRFVNTHLDGDCSDPEVQLAQAREIIKGPVQEARETDLPIILLGDLNSKADGTGTQTYAELLEPKVGFVDVWTDGGSGQGFTCCQDDRLDNPESVLSDRRDFILFRHGPFKVLNSKVIGADSADRTPSGLWPSDHAGVVTELRLPSEDE